MKSEPYVLQGAENVCWGMAALELDSPQGFRLRVRHPTLRNVVHTYPPPLHTSMTLFNHMHRVLSATCEKQNVPEKCTDIASIKDIVATDG